MCKIRTLRMPLSPPTDNLQKDVYTDNNNISIYSIPKVDRHHPLPNILYDWPAEVLYLILPGKRRYIPSVKTFLQEFVSYFSYITALTKGTRQTIYSPSLPTFTQYYRFSIMHISY